MTLISSDLENGVAILRFAEAKLVRGGSWIAEEITRNLDASRRFAFDLGTVEFINSECLTAFISGIQILQEAGASCAFFPSRRRLKMTFCSRCFASIRWFDDESAAVKHLLDRSAPAS